MRRTKRAPAALAALLLLLLSACGGGERASRAPAPYQIGGKSCMRALVSRGIVVEPWSAPRRGACRVDTPVRAVAGLTSHFARPVQTSCAMLVAWTDLEPDMQKAALRHLGSRVRSVRHYGSHSCRAMTGNAGRPSLHAAARAIDVSGFELADGRVVTVEGGWDGPRRERRFLRAVRDAACRRYGVVLGPEHDRRHRDHLHLDIGGWRMCD